MHTLRNLALEAPISQNLPNRFTPFDVSDLIAGFGQSRTSFTFTSQSFCCILVSSTLQAMAKNNYVLCQCTRCNQSQVAHPDTNQMVDGCLVKRSTRLSHDKQEQGMKYSLRRPKLKEDDALAALPSQIAQLRIQSHSPPLPSPKVSTSLAQSNESRTLSMNPTNTNHQARSTKPGIGKLQACLSYSSCL